MGRYVKTYTGASGGSQYSGSFAGSGDNLYSVPGTWEPINVCCNWKSDISSGTISYNCNFSCWEMIKFVIHSATYNSYSTVSTYVQFGSNCCNVNAACIYTNAYSTNNQYMPMCVISCCAAASFAYVGCGTTGYSLEICVWPGRGGFATSSAGGMYAEQRSFNNACSYNSPTVNYIATAAAVYYACCVNPSAFPCAFSYFTFCSPGLSPFSGAAADSYFGIYGMRRAVGPASNIIRQ